MRHATVCPFCRYLDELAQDYDLCPEGGIKESLVILQLLETEVKLKIELN